MVGEHYLPGLTGLSIGRGLVCGIDPTTSIVCGDGSNWTRNTTHTGIRKVSVGGKTICVLTSGYASCWGPNDYGQLGGSGDHEYLWLWQRIWLDQGSPERSVRFDNATNVWVSSGGQFTCRQFLNQVPACAGYFGGEKTIPYFSSVDYYNFPRKDLTEEPSRESCVNQHGDYIFCSGYFQSHPSQLVRGLPKAPDQITLENLSKTSVGISWVAPDGNGSAVTSQLLDYSNDFGATWIRLATLPTGAASYVAQSLATQDYLMFRIAGVNLDGTGEFKVSNVTPIGTVSSTVQNANVTVPSENTLVVEWDPPIDDGAFSINSYKVAFRIFGTTTWLDYATVPSDQNSVSVIGLEKGTKYEIRINSINAVGVSDSVFLAETPSIPPSKPVLNNPIVVNRNTVTIPFSIDDDGGMPPTGLFVRSRIIGTGTWENESELVSNQDSVTVHGLPSGERREFPSGAGRRILDYGLRERDRSGERHGDDGTASHHAWRLPHSGERHGDPDVSGVRAFAGNAVERAASLWFGEWDGAGRG